MRLIFKLAAAAVLGTALGLLMTWLMVTWPIVTWLGAGGRVSDGPWKTTIAAGTERSTPAARAFVALHGLFALSPSEAIYYTATTDSGGGALDGRCRYTLASPALDASWWSVTAYGTDDYLIANPAHRYSVTSSSLASLGAGARGAGGRLAIQVGGAAGGADWIPIGPGRFSLTLRLYKPGPTVRFAPAQALLPAVTKVACP